MEFDCTDGMLISRTGKDQWWQPVLELPESGPARELWEKHRPEWVTAENYSQQARQGMGHVVAYTPNGREVRRTKDGTLELQPPNDNYWAHVQNLDEAKKFWESKL